VHREWRSFEKSEYREGVCGRGFGTVFRHEVEGKSSSVILDQTL
jgi:hypothetical protein